MSEHTITTCKGAYTGTLIECLEWQATMQGAAPDIDGTDISDLWIAHGDDPYRDDDDLTPEDAETIVQSRMNQ